MPSPTHRAETMSWRVVKPNAPVAGRAPAHGPTPLHFLAAPGRLLSQGSEPDTLGDSPESTFFQAVGAVLIEVPLAGDLTGQHPLIGFAPLRQA